MRYAASLVTGSATGATTRAAVLATALAAVLAAVLLGLASGPALAQPAPLGPPQPDSDSDGIDDVDDLDPLDPMVCADSDSDGCDDCSVIGVADPSEDGPDSDSDGLCDSGDDDDDNDGIGDAGDNCPTVPNPDQADRDSDDLGDACDDSDADGLVDRFDNCPDSDNTGQDDLDGDGLGDACDDDRDGDGFADDLGLSGGGACSTTPAAPGSGLGWATLAQLAIMLLGLAALRRRRQCLRRRASATTALLTAALFGLLTGVLDRPAAAQEVRDFSVERFRLAGDGAGLIDVEWGAVPDHLSWDLAIHLAAADDPLVVSREMDDGSGQVSDRLGALVARRVGGTAIASLALWNRLQLIVDVPVILSQDRDAVPGVADPAPGTDSAALGSGLGDIRLAGKVQLLRHDLHGVDLAVIPAVLIPSAGADDYRGEDGLSLVPEVAIARALGAVRVAGNLGYRARRNTDVLDLAMVDELTFRAGLGYGLAGRTGVPAELMVTLAGAVAAARPLDAANQTYTEVLAGASYRAPGSIVAVIAA
ncbi:MAG: thrombospondin type 3 repeat-containing protein, partial [Myxococcota bacterium]